MHQGYDLCIECTVCIEMFVKQHSGLSCRAKTASVVGHSFSQTSGSLSHVLEFACFAL